MQSSPIQLHYLIKGRMENRWSAFVSFSICVNILSAKNIKIQIDSDDLLKLIGGVVNSETFRRFADQMVQRTAIKYGSYHNPYHPEDNVIKTAEADNTAEAAIDAKLEKSNEDFIKSGAENETEDKLEGTTVFEKAATAKLNVEYAYLPPQSPKTKLERRPDFDPKTNPLLQRRYKVKASQ